MDSQPLVCYLDRQVISTNGREPKLNQLVAMMAGGLFAERMIAHDLKIGRSARALLPKRISTCVHRNARSPIFELRVRRHLIWKACPAI